MPHPFTRVLLLATALLSVGPAGCADEPLEVATSVDLARFQGRWFEIAKLPRPAQSDCRGTKAYYRLEADDRLSVVHECRIGALDGTERVWRATAKRTDASVSAKLAIDVGGFFGDYWILEVGADYEYAVVGHPSRRYLWVLSRTSRLDRAKLDGVLARARANKFDVDALEYTEQPSEAP